MRNFVNFVLFQGGWFAGVILAGNGHPWLATFALLAVVLVHLLFVRDRRLESKVLLAAIPFGFVVDSVVASSGALAYSGQLSPYLCPPWIVAMWVLFAATFLHSFSWIVGRVALAAVLGAVAAPLSYLAGQRLGAVKFGEPLERSIPIIASVWSFALCAASVFVAKLVKSNASLPPRSPPRAISGGPETTGAVSP